MTGRFPGARGLSRRWGGLLVPLTWPYRAAVTWRARWWRERAASIPCRVVSVGNITCGGTGKTTMVERVVRDLRERGLRPAILSRGYGGDPRGPRVETPQGPLPASDEYRLLEANLPGVPHYLGRDRVATGRRAAAEGAAVVVLDDGFQHLRLRRDLDIVLLDSLDPFGGGRLLPAGLLREPLAALERADLLAWTRAELVGAEELRELVKLVASRAPRVPQACLETELLEWRDLEGERYSLETVRGEPVVGFCAIGNAESFRRHLLRLGCRLAGWLRYRDHHVYTLADARRIGACARRLGAALLVTTQKDAVKLEAPALREALALPCRTLRIQHAFRWGEERYREALEAAVAGAGTCGRALDQRQAERSS